MHAHFLYADECSLVYYFLQQKIFSYSKNSSLNKYKKCIKKDVSGCGYNMSAGKNDTVIFFAIFLFGKWRHFSMMKKILKFIAKVNIIKLKKLMHNEVENYYVLLKIR